MAAIQSGKEGTFTLRAATALSVVLFALFLIVLLFSILREQSDAQRRAEDRALAASQVVATNARWISELSRQALGRIDEALGPDIEHNAAATAALISDAIANLPGNVKAYVVAADGRTLFSTDPNVKPIDVRDREYFAALAEGRLLVHVEPDGQPTGRQPDIRLQQTPRARQGVRRRSDYFFRRRSPQGDLGVA